MDNYTTSLTNALMLAVAKRIAKTERTDPEAARQDFEQSIQPMTEAERAQFEQAIVTFAIMEG